MPGLEMYRAYSCVSCEINSSRKRYFTTQGSADARVTLILQFKNTEIRPGNLSSPTSIMGELHSRPLFDGLRL